MPPPPPRAPAAGPPLARSPAAAFFAGARRTPRRARCHAPVARAEHERARLSDVISASKRVKATTKAGAVKPKAAAAPAAPAAPAVPAPAADGGMSALDPRNLDTSITNLRDPGTENLDQAIENLRAKPIESSGKSRNLDEAITNARPGTPTPAKEAPAPRHLW